MIVYTKPFQIQVQMSSHEYIWGYHQENSTAIGNKRIKNGWWQKCNPLNYRLDSPFHLTDGFFWEEKKRQILPSYFIHQLSATLSAVLSIVLM